MAMMLTVLRLLAFLLSAAGYVAVARAYWKITPRASYLFVFSAEAVLIYFAGLAGVLSYAAYALFGGGIVLLVVLLANKKIKLAYNTTSINATNLAFVVTLGIITASLLTTSFVHYDNFSHWAVTQATKSAAIAGTIASNSFEMFWIVVIVSTPLLPATVAGIT